MIIPARRNPKVMVPRSQKKLESIYEVGKELGKGSFATVKLVKHKESSKNFAAKIIDTSELEDTGKQMIEIEAEVLKRVNHPNITRCFEILDNPDESITFILEQVTGGELFDKVVKLTFYSEANASKAIAQVTDAIMHMHSKQIMHRDLKPENLLLDSDADDADVKLADFGLSYVMKAPDERIRQAVGTPGYIAPETLLCLEDDDMTYGKECDLWSIGVILYILLCGFPPFYAEDDDDCFDLTIAGEYDFPSPYWDQISDEAKDLVKILLVTDPAKRATCAQVLEHPWIKACPSTDHLPQMQEELKKWRARRRWKKMGNAVIAAQRFGRVQRNTKKKKSSSKK